MARLAAPRTILLQSGIAVCLLLFQLPAIADQQSSPPPAVPNRNLSAKDLEDEGDLLRSEKRYLDAIDFYKAAAAKQQSALLWNKQGMSYLLIQRYEDATKCFNKAIKLDKRNAAAYNNRGYMEYRDKSYDKALHFYHKAVSLQPSDAVFQYNIGSAYFAMQDYTRAAQAFHQAYHLDPDIFNRVSKTGIIAQTTSPENRGAFSFMIAKMYAQAGDLEHSIEYLRKAMEEGYKHINKVYTDTEFASLREDKRFTELMAQKPQPIQ